MNKKCNKFETLFIFSDDDTLKQHVDECDECRKEYEKMQRVSELVHEVKDEYIKPKRTILKIACVLFLFFIGGISVDMLDVRYGILDTVKYGEPLTMEDLGFPTDDYGLIQVD